MVLYLVHIRNDDAAIIKIFVVSGEESKEKESACEMRWRAHCYVTFDAERYLAFDKVFLLTLPDRH